MTKSKQKSLNEFFKPYGSSSKSNIHGSPIRKPLRSKDQNTPSKKNTKIFIDLTVSSPTVVPIHVPTSLLVPTTLPSSSTSAIKLQNYSSISSGQQIQDPPGHIKSDLVHVDQPVNAVNQFFSKNKTTFSADMLSSQENEQVENNVFGKTSNSALEIAPESSVSSKRKAATIVVSDDEDSSPVAGSSQNLNLESLTALGIKNMEKLKSTKQFPDGPMAKKCQSCGDDMDWKTTGTLKGRVNKNGVLTYYSYGNACKGVCVKEAYSDKCTDKRDEKHRKIKEAAAEISDPILKKQKMMESAIFSGIQKRAEKNQSIKKEAAVISDPILKKQKLMESVVFAGTQKRAEIVSTPGNVKEFLEETARRLRGRSPNFEPNNADDIEKSKDFIAILFSTGQVTAEDVATPLTNRHTLIEDIKTNPKFTVHTGLPALFHRSSTFDMVSPDRSICIQLENGSTNCPDYLDPRQITVLASHFSQRFFNATPHRSRLLNKLIGFYLDPIAMKIEFDSRFDYMDKRLGLYLSCETGEKRRALARKFPQTTDKTIRQKIQTIFSKMKTGNQDPRYNKVKEIKNDFNSWEEVDDLFRIFEYRCVVTGIAWDEGLVISIDKFVTTGSRYNWFDCVPMLWRLNDAKNAERKTFETRESLQAYMEANGMGNLHPLQALVQIMRVQFKALVSHSFAIHGYGPTQEPFDDSLKATGVED